jgi:hypothetical protein
MPFEELMNPIVCVMTASAVTFLVSAFHDAAEAALKTMEGDARVLLPAII